VSSSDEPQDETSGEDGASPGARTFREPSEPVPGDDTLTGIIRRHPTGPIPEPLSDDTRTSIIRRQPTSLEPTGPEESGTAIIRPQPVWIPSQLKPPSNKTAVAAAAVSIISGWATSVVATGLITGWWRTDRLFCVGVGFLTAVFGAATIAGVVELLLRRRVGIFLSVVAAVLALLIFSGIFIAGAHMAGVVYGFPALPAATSVLALAPSTWRWTKPG
jgi:hypothetical protein